MNAFHVEQKIAAHQAEGFGFKSYKSLELSEWLRLRAWNKDNPGQMLRRGDMLDTGVFVRYMRSAKNGMLVADLATVGTKYEGIKETAKNKYLRKLGKSRESRLKNWIRIARAGANQRGIFFDLAVGELEELYGMPCFYCGDCPLPDKSFGIDRMHNASGYVFDNCVPCCWPCNSAKHVSNFDDFILRAKRIAGRF